VEASRLATIDLINQSSGQTGVIAEDNGESITLRAVDGRNVSLAVGTTGGDANDFVGLDDAVDGIGTVASTGGAVVASASVAETTYSTVTLKSAGEIVIAGGTSGTTGLSDSGFRAGSYGGAESGQFLNEVDISTLDGANKALTALDNALDTVNAERANLGAIQNRFDSTIANLSINSENLTAANSRITDADFAAETAALSRSQVLQQAGISILAQANALPQQALSLLQ
jgi:flagellin